MDLDLTGRTALVTGSTRGIGLATAVGLGEMRANVLIHGRDEARVSEAVARASDQVPGGSFDGVAGDLATAAGCDKVAAAHPALDGGNRVVQARRRFRHSRYSMRRHGRHRGA